jgi:SAM-dependent methyltransferase
MPDQNTSNIVPRGDRRKLVSETRKIWEQNAAFWDERLGEGDEFQKRLVVPVVDGLLGAAPGERILEIACGNGAFARHLAALGAEVVATDYSETFIARARKRPQMGGRKIDFQVIDATDERALIALGRREFDAAVCNMSLTDMAAIEPLFWAIPRLLKPGGRFVFTIMHPCFNHAGSRFLAEEESCDDGLRTRYSLKVNAYLDVPGSRDITAEGQPMSHFTFHRPLSEILNAAFNAGLVMDGVAEPAYAGGGTAQRLLSWMNMPNIPPVFAARFRPSGMIDR